MNEIDTTVAEFKVKLRKTDGSAIEVVDNAIEVKFLMSSLLKDETITDHWSEFAKTLTERWKDRLEGIVVSPALAATIFHNIKEQTLDVKKNTDQS